MGKLVRKLVTRYVVMIWTAEGHLTEARTSDDFSFDDHSTFEEACAEILDCGDAYKEYMVVPVVSVAEELPEWSGP